MADNTRRFSDRVADYTMYRPGYPPELVRFLVSRLGLSISSVAADVGAGTGIFTERLLDVFAAVHAVEPNDAMRTEAEQRLGDRRGFVSSRGTSEATGLEESSVDLVTAAQAFHWFDRDAAGREFRRILRQPGYVAVVRNLRINDHGFTSGYEHCLRTMVPEYSKVNHYRLTPDDIRDFVPVDFGSADFFHSQFFDFDGVMGRLASSSYAPKKDKPGYQRLSDALERLFDDHQKNGVVEYPYRTELCFGRFR